MRKMIMAVVPRDEFDAVLQALVANGYTATFSESKGGILRQAQQILFIAVAQEELEQVISIIRDNCHTRVKADRLQPAGGHPSPKTNQKKVGGAVIFVWDLDRFEIY
jgi:uncharacterized protein YaaQ